MNQLEYVPGIGGASVQLDGPSSFVGIAENLRSREWEYDLGYRDLVSATRPAREVDVTFNADYATADELRRVADADVTARTPGVFVAQKEWRQRGYILASQPNDIHYGRLSTELKIALLDGAWWRLVDKTFMPENTAPTYKSATGKSVTTVEAANVPLHALTVDGESVQDGTPTPSAPVPVEVVQSINLANTSNVFMGYVANNQMYADSRNYVVVIPCKPNTAYTLAMTIPNQYSRYSLGVTDVYPAANVAVSNFIPHKLAGGTSEVGYRYTDTITTGANAKYIVAWCGNASSDYPNGIDFQVEEGSTATPYTPYGSIGLKAGDTVTLINLQGNVLASLPDGTRDTVTVDSAGHVTLEKRTNTKVLDGSESWSNSSGFAYTAKPSDIADGQGSATANILMTDRFKVEQSTSGGNCYISGTNILFYKDSYFNPSSGADAKTWAAANNITLLYKLATPQTIDLGYIEMPSVSDGSVVSITAEVTPTITAEWQTSPDLYLDYPHNYPYDYQKTSSTGSITPSVLTPSDVHLVVYGPAVNPYVIVGGNRYQINVTVPSGGYLVVDGRDKTINLTLADGTVQNVFSSGVRGGGAGGGSYIFEKVPAGTSEVTYDGSFGFDLGWYEEEGEPPWSQS